MNRSVLLLLGVLVLGGSGAWAWFALPPRLSIALAASGPALEAVYATGAVEPVRWARVGPATRARVTHEGFGARLLAAQGDDGLWAGGAHFPADFTGQEPQHPHAPDAGECVGHPQHHRRPSTAGFERQDQETGDPAALRHTPRYP